MYPHASQRTGDCMASPQMQVSGQPARITLLERPKVELIEPAFKDGQMRQHGFGFVVLLIDCSKANILDLAAATSTAVHWARVAYGRDTKQVNKCTLDQVQVGLEHTQPHFTSLNDDQVQVGLEHNGKVRLCVFKANLHLVTPQSNAHGKRVKIDHILALTDNQVVALIKADGKLNVFSCVMGGLEVQAPSAPSSSTCSPPPRPTASSSSDRGAFPTSFTTAPTYTNLPSSSSTWTFGRGAQSRSISGLGYAHVPFYGYLGGRDEGTLFTCLWTECAPSSPLVRTGDDLPRPAKDHRELPTSTSFPYMLHPEKDFSLLKVAFP
ncbi:hypothetical protein H257_07125 [Aphanomyces astaci]|uniref:Uncharacterized protein n=1 Tax=Aphanomyces astaci TaxID=112090 RepID=W4GJQ0_APHAT|nr:hypothetical protein H257_07125 [Aphanomyces astaci]ETV79922.1 hypothetical protein H257_07125 [Aphanomyces astaci]|eukprot:XP_009830858.1 hypothetical protein H257_07125 [Aphanomyces astaci]